MTSFVERMIESWLDSQTERRYQPAFIQLLVSEGWSVLHNTRHSPIEFGKDVIARDPKGVLHCFQLKSNPGSRLTKSEAQRILPQLVELLDLEPASLYRASAQERHIAVLVTNGEVDEEARLMFEAAAARTKRRSCPARRFELWSRGPLLSRFLSCAGKVWPTSVEGARQVLDLMTEDGRAHPDPKAISRTFAAVAPAPSRKTSSASKASSLASLLLLAEIVKSPWYAADNHYGLYMISVLASVHALRFADSAKRLSTVTQYADLCLEHCADLLVEAKASNFDPDLVWAQSDVPSEFDVMWERRRLVGDCAATLVLGERPHVHYDAKYAANLIIASFARPRFWGFGAVPALMVRYWAACRIHAGSDLEITFGRHLHTILEASLGQLHGVSPLASPYYGFIDCWAFSKNIRHFADDEIFSDSFVRRIWFGRAMFFMLAKRNLKRTCKQIWPLFTRVVHEEPGLPSATFFDSLLAKDGEMHTYTFHRKNWNELVREAVDSCDGEFLSSFSALAWLIAAYVAIVPYRAWTGVLMWLDDTLNKTWYRQDYLPLP